MVPLSFADQEMLLVDDRALYWPREAALLVADLHLEKASWYAKAGQMLPPYDSRATLEALDDVIAREDPVLHRLLDRQQVVRGRYELAVAQQVPTVQTAIQRDQQQQQALQRALAPGRRAQPGQQPAGAGAERPPLAQIT